MILFSERPMEKEATQEVENETEETPGHEDEMALEVANPMICRGKEKKREWMNERGIETMKKCKYST